MPLRLLVVDKVAVLSSNRLRWKRLVAQANIQMTLLSPTRWIENCVDVEFQHAETNEGYRTVLGHVSCPGRELRSIYFNGVIRALRASRPEVIILMEESFSMFALQIVLAARLLAPQAHIIFYNLNITSYRPLPYRPSWVYALISRIVVARSRTAICLNDRAAEVLRDGGYNGDIHVLFFGINDEIFAPRDRATARKKLGLDPNATILLYAGRLLELKGIDDLLVALHHLIDERPDKQLRLLVVGDGEYRTSLYEHVRRLGLDSVVEFRPAVPIETMPDYIAAANIFVLPSRSAWNEQFGRVNAEAMLMGTTIVGSTSGTIPSVIGDGGYVFTADNPLSLAETIGRVLDQPNENERRQRVARTRALGLYGVSGFVDGVIDLLESIAGRQLRRPRTKDAI